MHAFCLEEASKVTGWAIGIAVAVVVIFVAVVAFSRYRKYKRRRHLTIVRNTYGATSTNVTINIIAMQPDVKAHSGKYPTQPSYPQQPYPLARQGYMSQQQIYARTGGYPQQPQAQAGMTLKAISLVLCLPLKS